MSGATHASCDLAGPHRLVRLTVGAGNNHDVAVRVFDPDLAMTRTIALALWGIAVRRSYDLCVELLSAPHGAVEIGYFTEPEQHSVTNIKISAGEDPVVVLDVSMMELQHECVLGKQPLVLRTTMITTEAQQLLIPTARCFHVAYGDHGLRLYGGNAYHNADSVASRIIDLDKPPLTSIERRAPAHPAASVLDLLERAVQTVGRDPGNRTAGGWCDVGGQLADQARCFKASVARIDGPAKDSFIEGGRTLDVEGGNLQVFNLAMDRRIRISHACSIDYG